MKTYKFTIRGKHLFAEEMVMKLTIPRDDELKDKVVAILERINAAEYESQTVKAWAELDELLETAMLNSKTGKVKLELEKVYFPPHFRPRRLRRRVDEELGEITEEEEEKFRKILDGILNEQEGE